MIPVDAQAGIAIFDEPASSHGSGFASVAGKEAFRFKGVDALSRDVIWVTTLDAIDLQPLAESHPHLRRRNFFRSDVATIAWDYGVDITAKPGAAATFLSALLNRVLRITRNAYGIEYFGDSLADTLHAQMVTENDEPRLTQGYRELIRQAYVNVHQCPTRVRGDDEVISLRWPRAGYAALILQYPVPIGGWHEFTGGAPSDPDQTYSFLCEIAKRACGIVKVAIERPPEGYIGLIDIGMSEARSWVPLQEAAFLARIASVRLLRVLISESFVTPNQNTRWRLPDFGAVAQVSPTAGLIAEAHWTALATSTWVNSGGRRIQRTSPRAISMRAWDRLVCLRGAYELSTMGARVVNYGGGGISVAVSPERRIELVKMAAKLHLVAPISITAQLSATSQAQVSGAAK